MVDVKRTEPGAAARPLAAHKDYPEDRLLFEQPRPDGDDDRGRERRQPSPHGVVADRASVLGIPARAVTPEIEHAIAGLMGDVDALRLQLAQTKRRESYLEELADQDALVPVRNHRAFVRELSRTLAHVARSGMPSCLVYLDLLNGGAIKREHGLRALEGALIHVALLLNAQVRGTDVVGNLGGAGFGVILSVTGNEAAIDKAAQLVEVIESRPFFWLGRLIDIKVGCGVHRLRPGDTAEDAIDAADRAAREGAAREDGE